MKINACIFVRQATVFTDLKSSISPEPHCHANAVRGPGGEGTVSSHSEQNYTLKNVILSEANTHSCVRVKFFRFYYY